MPTQMKVKPMKSKNAINPKVSTDAQLMTSSQSLNVVKTLIQTGIGVITYLRGIFPEECFTDDRIGPDRSETYDEATEGQKKTGREGRGYIRVKHINRGASKESDKVLDYLDEGAMDAIQRGYLRQLLFAMYLDPDKPRDVIECYTFNITYSKSKDREGELVPELEVRDQLRELSLGGKISILNENDPQQSRKTCGMVKRQVQALIKNLICSTQSLSDIHGRRFLTFKLHYNDQTPLDYEPPHFTAGDVELDRFTFGTSGVEEVPSATEMGRIDTGFHAVRVALATISGYLPESNASDSKALPKGKSPLELREIELNKIREEAKEREVVWDTEKVLAPSPPMTPNGFNKADEQSIIEPIGRRDHDGRLVPLPRQNDNANETENGAIKILKRKATPESNVIPESDPMLNSTQTEIQSQSTPVSLSHGVHTDNLAWSLRSIESNHKLPQAHEIRPDSPRIEEDNQSEVFQEKAISSSKPGNNNFADTTDDPILEASISTQIVNTTHLKENVESLPDAFDPIESFPSSSGTQLKSKGLPPLSAARKSRPKEKKDLDRKTDDGIRKTDSNKKIKSSHTKWPPSSNKSDICECRDANDDQDMINCEICKRWRHLNCYGYTSEKDPRIPEFFTCYRCRIHKGMGLEEIWNREDDINIALEGLRGLCIFRRTLQIIYQEGLPAVMKDLALRLEVDLSTVSQIKHRLENENFICPKSNKRSNSSGLLESERKGSSKPNQSKRWIKHMIVNESYEQKKLRDTLYFTPGTGTEAKLLAKFENGAKEIDADEQANESR
ncbi:DNA binding protein [Puccinia graminis f. sp. tritici]|uniref:DNA binding protein n=1 Tax=Puccinia graminis f. sp. tritici TaxID=56615 RepID=A0A5B0N3E4_PUCGR|nr:DNA binding protein [Puccinia graminis f. sp. tritici]